MFCSNCGKQIEDGSLFCPSCGASVASYEEPKDEVVNEPTPLQ